MDRTDRKRKTDFLRKGAVGALVGLIWILLWEGVSLLVHQELLVPSPLKVFARLLAMFPTAFFWQTAAVTVSRILAGFAAGVALGVGIAVLTSVSPVARAFFRPLQGVVKATPVASFIILALLWIQSGQIPGFISFLMVLPIVWANVFKGIAETDPNLLEMAKLYRVRKIDIVRKIYVNSVLPYFVPAAMTSMGLAWKAGIAAEVLSVPKFSIGREIYNAKLYLETIDLFAWSLAVIVISVILEKIIAVLLKKLLPDRMSARESAESAKRQEMGE